MNQQSAFVGGGGGGLACKHLVQTHLPPLRALSTPSWERTVSEVFSGLGCFCKTADLERGFGSSGFHCLPGHCPSGYLPLLSFCPWKTRYRLLGVAEGVDEILGSEGAWGALRSGPRWEMGLE